MSQRQKLRHVENFHGSDCMLRASSNNIFEVIEDKKNFLEFKRGCKKIAKRLQDTTDINYFPELKGKRRLQHMLL